MTVNLLPAFNVTLSLYCEGLLKVVSELIVRVSAGTYPNVPKTVFPSTIRLLLRVVAPST